MKLIKLIIIALASFASSRAHAATYNYDKTVTLSGELVSENADPSITIDEKAHKFPALRLENPINTLCSKSDDDCQIELGVSLLHLSLDTEQMVKFKKMKGNPARVTGFLFHSDNGNHFTSVLLKVKSIEPARK